MGIKGLLVFLREKCPEIVQHVELSAFKGYRIAIDLPIFCYQKKSEAISKLAAKLDLVYEDIDYHYCTMFMIKKILTILENILHAGVIPVPVFDGVAPRLKGATKKNRKDKSDKKENNISNLKRIIRGLLSKTEIDKRKEYNNDGTHNKTFIGSDVRVSDLNTSNLVIETGIVKRMENKVEITVESRIEEPFQLSEWDIDFLKRFKKPVQTIEDLKKILLNEIKQWVVVTSQDYLILGTIFSSLGIPHVYAQSEAEQTCAQMCKFKDVIAIFTADSDSLVYGCPIMINEISLSTGIRVRGPAQAQCYVFANVLSVLGLTHPAFIDFCLMSGTDFNPNSPAYGPARNYELIKHYGSFNAIIQAKKELADKPIAIKGMTKIEKLIAGYDPTVINYDEVRCFFTEPITYDRNSLKIRIIENQYEKAFHMLEKMMGATNFNQIMDISRKLLGMLVKANIECKHPDI
jgi:5'-3' exonuclease